MRFCNVQVGDTTFRVTLEDAKHVARAFELIAVVKSNASGPWQGSSSYDRWQHSTVLQLLSLETGIHDILLVGAVDIATAMVNRKAVWSPWQDEMQERMTSLPM